jgi:hypothetical protein
MKDIEESKVGSGTAVADKSAEKRAQLSLKMVQLRMKQNKERLALAAQKKSLKKEETMTESFSPSQIAALKAEYSKINTIDPSSDTYKKLIAMLDKLDLKSLKALADANVKFVSKLAQNRVMRKSMKKEDVQLDELSNDKLADYKKKAGADASAADKAGDIKKGNKRFSGIMKATRKQFDNDAKQKTEELSPKQKAMDKNKNGKIDGSDLAKLRKEETDLEEGGEKYKVKSIGYDSKKGDYFVHPTTGEKVYKSGVNKGDHVNPKTGEVKKKVAESLDEGKSDYEIYHKDYSSAVQTAIKQAEKRGFEVDMDDWHDKVATGPKKPSSGKTNSFSINLMKDGKPSKKKLQMQVYNMDNQKYELNMYIESVEEAASPAQQAAIAIAMKKAGKKPKNMKESLVDKIKAMKRGAEAKAKADDHFDKAGDPKNANASKDLKKAVRYHNLLNKEEVVLEAKKKTFKDVKKKMKEETPNNASVKKGEPLTGKKEPIEINPELKEEVK